MSQTRLRHNSLCRKTVSYSPIYSNDNSSGPECFWRNLAITMQSFALGLGRRLFVRLSSVCLWFEFIVTMHLQVGLCGF